MSERALPHPGTQHRQKEPGRRTQLPPRLRPRPFRRQCRTSLRPPCRSRETRSPQAHLTGNRKPRRLKQPRYRLPRFRRLRLRLRLLLLSPVLNPHLWLRPCRLPLRLRLRLRRRPHRCARWPNAPQNRWIKRRRRPTPPCRTRRNPPVTRRRPPPLRQVRRTPGPSPRPLPPRRLIPARLRPRPPRREIRSLTGPRPPHPHVITVCRRCPEPRSTRPPRSRPRYSASWKVAQPASRSPCDLTNSAASM